MPVVFSRTSQDWSSVFSPGLWFGLLICFQSGVCSQENEVALLLTSHCIECHNDEDLKGGLNLTTHEGWRHGGDSGLPFNKERPTQSLLLERLESGEMPPPERGRSRKLPDKDIAILKRWLSDGAPWPSERPLDRFEQTTDVRAGRDWWAFQPIQRPSRAGQSPLTNPIDAFVLARLAEEGLEQAPLAAKRHLIRRATFDLTGLPPSPAEVTAFENDPSPLAYSHLLDRLLSSPHYGERWGRHWLDVVRFAETDGYERDRLKANAWRYRDWVIQALNDDMPYDRFVIDQLAGDEVPHRDENSVIATGMLRVGTWNDEPNDPADYVYERLEDMVHTTSSTFLGLTIKCARCHDHKFDPILQADYYRVASYFWAGPIGQSNQGGPTPEQLGFDNIYGWTDLGATAKPIHLLKKGERHQPGQRIEPGFPSTLRQLTRSFQPPPKGAQTTQRRLQFAQWLTDPENPLTPRVLVNRLWQHHFGQGIVRTPNNFGFKSAPPSHPDLLDWLAAELVHPTRAPGAPWTLKRLHKLIMMSRTYRQASLHPEHMQADLKDPQNHLLWHFPRRRLDAEALRDAMLVTSGTLSPAYGGPSFFPRMSGEALEGLSRKQAAWQESPAPDRTRRSVYMMTQRSRLLPLMTTFDFTETTSSCAQRDVTTVAPQALALLNNHFVHTQSTAFARRVLALAPTNHDEQIHAAWRFALQRPPSNKELAQARDHLSVQTAHFLEQQDATPKQRALESLCHVLLNTNEFIYID